MVLRTEISWTDPRRARRSDARAWIEVDLGILQGNVAALVGRLHRGCRLIAVVKGDAYGHGMVPAARAALAGGAAALAVANAGEGAELREAGIDAEVMIIGPSVVEDVPLILAHDLVPALADARLAIALDRAADRPCRVQVEVDTGLRRHGVPAGAAVALVRRVRGLRRLRLAGVYTHFGAITPADEPLAREQFTVFRTVLRDLDDDGHRTAVHACNTLSSTLLPGAHFDALRIGGGLHGLGATARALGLTPVLTLRTRVAAVRRVAHGDRVGYGGAHTCARDTTLAVLPCGYADGLPRATWTGRDVLVHGCRAPIVGLVSMNQTIVDVGHVPGRVAPGDEVVLLGAQGKERVRAEERVPAGGSAYEVTTLLGPGLPRSYRNPPPRCDDDVARARSRSASVRESADVRGNLRPR